MLAFQLFLIASGNLSFLNWLTIVPVLACFDDAFLRRLLPRTRGGGGRARGGDGRRVAGAADLRRRPRRVGRRS